MDIDTLTDEVMRRLMKKIREEQSAVPPEHIEASTQDASNCCSSTSGKLVITQDKAASIAPGSRMKFPQGTIITPLARDTFKERGVCIEFE